MKAFYASIIVFALLLVLILCNGAYVRRTTAEMQILLEKEPTLLSNIEKHWQMARRTLALSVSFDEIRMLDEHLLAMRAALETGARTDFERHRLLAIETLRRIREPEELSLDNLI